MSMVQCKIGKTKITKNKGIGETRPLIPAKRLGNFLSPAVIKLPGHVPHQHARDCESCHSPVIRILEQRILNLTATFDAPRDLSGGLVVPHNG